MKVFSEEERKQIIRQLELKAISLYADKKLTDSQTITEAIEIIKAEENDE